MGKTTTVTDHHERECLRGALTLMADKYDTMARTSEKMQDEQLRKLNMVKSAYCVKLRGKFTEGGTKQDATDNQQDAFEPEDDVVDGEFQVIGEIASGNGEVEVVCPDCGNKDLHVGLDKGEKYPPCSAQCKGDKSPNMIESIPETQIGPSEAVIWKCPSCAEPHSKVPKACTQCGFELVGVSEVSE